MLLAVLGLISAGWLVPAAAQAHIRSKPRPGPKPSPVVTTVHVPRHHGPVVSTTLTTHDVHYELSRMPSQYFARTRTTRPILLVNDHIRYQRIIGFGGAMTDSSAWLIQTELTQWQRNRAMQALFSPTAGIGLNVTRVPIGASDFTATGVPYTYDDEPAGQTDPELTNFSIAHDQAYIIPALSDMLAQNPKVKILATPWTAPAWMKANDQLSDTGDAGPLLSEYYPQFADYLVKFVTAYQALGIPIWALTPENEPLSAARFPSMLLPAAQEAQFITDDLLPALSQANLQTEIFGNDGSGVAYAESLEQSPPGPALAGMAWHCYHGQQLMSQFHEAYPNVVNLTSECSPGIVPYAVSETALSGLNNFSSLIQLWNLALDTHGGPVEPPNSGCNHCTGVVTVNPQTHRVELRLNYYQLGQFSKFIRPGAVRVAATRFVTEFTSPTAPRYGVTPGLDDAAFVDPGGKRVLVVYNNSTQERYFAVRWDGLTFNYRLPGRATVTFQWRSRG